jgi:alpha-beta hydrolase superfamily lysophospholipase/SAM-dependent methyltransferase
MSEVAQWQETQSGFTHDQVRFFYRHWQNAAFDASAPSAGAKTAIFIHRGHEHSGRIAPLLHLAQTADSAFCFDHRGHGYTPGERGDAPSFSAMVEDFAAFVRHLQAAHKIDLAHTVIVANSVGAVIAATWLLDYGQRIAGVVMAAAAFEINLYVPFAAAGLRLATKFNPDMFITSYIQPGMLTHDQAQAQRYASDPLVTKNISARVLLDLAKVAKRVVINAASIDTPCVMLCAGKDYVVKRKPQQQFFNQLSHPDKQFILVDQAKHAFLYEREDLISDAIMQVKSFIERVLSEGAQRHQRYLSWDKDSHSARAFTALQNNLLGSALEKANFAAQKFLLGTLGKLSNGMQVGMRHGFDSGASLDYVYQNQPRGRLLIGKMIDQGYLQATGWRGVRLRRSHLQQQLQTAIDACLSAHGKVHIADLACGGGRYVLETLKRNAQANISAQLQDFTDSSLAEAKALHESLGLSHSVAFLKADAFAQMGADASGSRSADVVIVSGLLELFPDNAKAQAAFANAAYLCKPGGVLIYTGQPWHPQLLMIAKTLSNHRGAAWQMRPRAQVELNALVEAAGFHLQRTQIGLEGIFTVSTALRR